MRRSCPASLSLLAAAAALLVAAPAGAAVSGCLVDASGDPLANLVVTWPSTFLTDAIPCSTWDNPVAPRDGFLTDEDGCVTIPEAEGATFVRVWAQSPAARVKAPAQVGLGMCPVSQRAFLPDGMTVDVAGQNDSFELAMALNDAYVGGLEEFSPFAGPWALSSDRTSSNWIEAAMPGLVVQRAFCEPASAQTGQPVIHLSAGVDGDTSGERVTIAHELAHALAQSRLSYGERVAMEATYAQWLADESINGDPAHGFAMQTTPFVAWIEAFGILGSSYVAAVADATESGEDRHETFYRRARARVGYDTVAGPDVEGAVFGALFVDFASHPWVGLDYVVSSYVDCGALNVANYGACILQREGADSVIYQALLDATCRFDIPLTGASPYCGALAQSYHGTGAAEEGGDSFGQVLASGDFDRDGRQDLAVGAPGENNGAGVVMVYRGSPRGFVEGRYLFQSSFGSASVEAGDSFGSALAVGDFDCDGRDDLAVGAMGENGSAGAVSVMYSGADGLDDSQAHTFLQRHTTYVAGNGNCYRPSSEPWDRFGAALAAGDFDGDGCGDLAVGAPGENGGKGIAHVFLGAGSGLDLDGWLYFQSSSADGSPADEAAEAGDRFGSALAVGRFNGDFRDDLVVGAPQEGAVAWRSGAVSVLFGSGGAVPLTAGRFYTPAGDSQANTGHSLAVGDFDGDGDDDIAAGAPMDRVDGSISGRVWIVYSGSAGLPTSAWAGGFVDATVSGAPSGRVGGFGTSLAAGDIDDDGQDELLVGEPSVVGGGRAHVIRLDPQWPDGIELAPEDWGREGLAGDLFGVAVWAADFDFDGDDDVAFGAPAAIPLAAEAGGVFYSLELDESFPAEDQSWNFLARLLGW